MNNRVTEVNRHLKGLLLLLILGSIGWVSACSPAGLVAPSPDFRPYTLYLYPWAEDLDENRLIPLDPESLASHIDGHTMELGRMWQLSADGSTLVNVENSEAGVGLDLKTSWIVVYDFQTGVEKNRFHPPAKGLITQLSGDGSRLLLQADADPYSNSSYPPRVEWYVVDTAHGELLAHIKDDDAACFRQKAHLDPAGQRVYCVIDPAVTPADESGPMQIVVYDVDSGRRALTLELPQVLIGAPSRTISGRSSEALLEPAVGLSPDGQRLAIVHADEARITLVDSHNLTVETTFSLEPGRTVWNRLGLSAATVQAKGEIEGIIRHAAFSSDGQYLYVFTQELRLDPSDAPAERGLWLIDLEKGSIIAKALPDYQVQWVRPAPDGTAYAFGTTDQRLLPYEIRRTSPSVLWHLDGRTLNVLAERAFTGYQAGRLVGGTAATHYAASSHGSYANCPVTRPPEPAFIPPVPWPARPPGSGRFWYGSAGLWASLPTDGSWPQLALGEKLWLWSDVFDVAEDATPDLNVTARRLNGDELEFKTAEATNGFHESFNWAMLVGVDLPAPGCWEFSGQFKTHQLSFVVWVPER